MRVDYSVARAERVRLSVIDVQGRVVAVLASGNLAAGPHQATWSGNASPGLYFVRLEGRGVSAIRRVVVAR